MAVADASFRANRLIVQEKVTKGQEMKQQKLAVAMVNAAALDSSSAAGSSSAVLTPAGGTMLAAGSQAL